MIWILTHSGIHFNPQEPKPEDLCIGDIAHALSLLCRFNGHCRTFYSVAEHCVRVSLSCPPQDALWGLLHDLGEAYLGDLPRPIKAAFPLFDAWEQNLMHTAAEKFGLAWPLPDSVHRADDILLATEIRDLMTRTEDSWELKAQPLAERITPLSPVDAEQAFLQRYAELTRQPHPASTPKPPLAMPLNR